MMVIKESRGNNKYIRWRCRRCVNGNNNWNNFNGKANNTCNKNNENGNINTNNRRNDKSRCGNENNFNNRRARIKHARY